MTKNLYLFTGILIASIATALASTPSPSPSSGPSFKTSIYPSLHPDAPGARTDGRADALNNTGIYNSVDQLGDVPTTAGAKSVGKPIIRPGIAPIYSLFGEYNYLNTNDERPLGSDTQTHSMTIGGSVLLNHDLLLGVNYSYSRTDSDVNILGNYSNQDANFVSLVVAKSFWRFLSVGVAGGYGRTEIDVIGNGAKAPADMDTWSVSPFLSASVKTGRFTTSLTTTYQYENDHTTSDAIPRPINDDTSKFNVALRGTYAATEKLKIQAMAKFTTVINGTAETPGLPESRNWATFGGRVSYNVTRPLEIYAGYAYDAFNVHLETFTITGGLRYTF